MNEPEIRTEDVAAPSGVTEPSEASKRFRREWEADRAAARPRSLEEYQARYPGLESCIADEHAHLIGEYTAVLEPLSSGSTLLRLLSQGTRDYEAEEEIARGGMGSILRIHDASLNRDLAMKLILGDAGLIDAEDSGDGAESGEPDRNVRRFLQEAQVMAQLDHPGVVPVHELGVNGEGRVFFTMKLVRGRTLSEVLLLVLNGREGWTLTKAVQIFIRLCETLAFAHSKWVIHRDLKPANVMVGRFGEVYLMDWGLAKVLGGGGSSAPSTGPADPEYRPVTTEADPPGGPLTLDGDILGTPSYIPPEQILGEVDEQGTHSDIYSVGAMLYHLLAGMAPYESEAGGSSPGEVLRAMRKGPPLAIRKLARKAPSELVAIAEKAMSEDPTDRYATVAELGEDLHNYLDGRVVGALGGGPVRELRKWMKRNPALAAALALLCMVMVGVAVGYGFLQKSAAGDVRVEAARAKGAELLATTALRSAVESDERWVREHPTVPGLVGSGLRALREGDTDRASAWMSKALELDARDPLGHYGEACVLARRVGREPEGSSESLSLAATALDELATALSLGYEDRDRLAQDPRLAALRDHPRWKTVLGR